jgi:hypothetical protein
MNWSDIALIGACAFFLLAIGYLAGSIHVLEEWRKAQGEDNGQGET